ncbi:MAG: hypothetical protein R3B93_27630 [Bacteroidia bacterium]
MITKNSLILRDLDLLKSLARSSRSRLLRLPPWMKNCEGQWNLVQLALRRLETVRQLADDRNSCQVMMGPIIPGLSNHEIPRISQSSS